MQLEKGQDQLAWTRFRHKKIVVVQNLNTLKIYHESLLGISPDTREELVALFK